MSQGPSYRTHEEIVGGIRQQDPGAFEALFDRFADLVYGFSLKLCGDVGTAREILQRAFIDALPYLKDAKTEHAIERVLLREASQRFLALRRGDGRGGGREIPLEELLPQSAGGKAGSAHDWSLDPDEEARRSEEKRLLRELVPGLPAHYGLVLVLCDMEEMTGQEVADILKISVPTVKARLHRARLLLRRELTHRLVGPGRPGSGAAS